MWWRGGAGEHRWLGRALGGVTVGIVAAATLAGCAGDGPSDPPPPTITLAENPWSGSRVDAAVAAVLLDQELGFAVQIVPIDEFAQWPAIASGALHASLEVWPSGHAANVAEYIERTQSVANAGPLGVIGKIGWYVPRYVLAAHPALASWEGLSGSDAAALFRTPASGMKGQFLTGDPTWVQYDAQIIANLGLDFAVVYAGSESALLAQVAEAHRTKSPLLFYFWTPHAAHERYDLAEVRLPPYSAACYAKAESGGIDCDYPSDALFKIVWPGLATYAPKAYAFFTRMQYSTDDQTELLASVDLDGLTPDSAARRWIERHRDVWRGWLAAGN